MALAVLWGMAGFINHLTMTCVVRYQTERLKEKKREKVSLRKNVSPGEGRSSSGPLAAAAAAEAVNANWSWLMELMDGAVVGSPLHIGPRKSWSVHPLFHGACQMWYYSFKCIFSACYYTRNDWAEYIQQELFVKPGWLWNNDIFFFFSSWSSAKKKRERISSKSLRRL